MIYIYSPVNAITGGVELLQQLGYKINTFGGRAKIIYVPTRFKRVLTYRKYETPKIYEIYGMESAYKIEDLSTNSVVIPETLFWKLADIKNAKKYLWWLSVDFYFQTTEKFYTKMRMFGKRIDMKSQDITHLVQSKYAAEWLEQQGVAKENILFLSDYLRNNFIEQVELEGKMIKKQQVLYNPKKGFEFTKKIISRTEYQCIPLEGYTPGEMASIMKESMVYIDFGNHPGKDRIPRESAISGCCVITGKRGAAANDFDIPINDEFKFKDEDASIEDIVICIDRIMKNYGEYRKKYDNYRDMIRREEEVFNNQVKKIFFTS